MICVTVLFDAMMAALLSHTYLMWRRQTKPDWCNMQMTASPDIMPPSSDLYDIMYALSPSSGPPPDVIISSFLSASIQLW
jgi:hypothetical protein